MINKHFVNKRRISAFVLGGTALVSSAWMLTHVAFAKDLSAAQAAAENKVLEADVDADADGADTEAAYAEVKEAAAESKAFDSQDNDQMEQQDQAGKNTADTLAEMAAAKSKTAEVYRNMQQNYSELQADETKEISTDEQGITYDKNGNVLVPAEAIENGYLTLEDLQRICGDSLILVKDKNDHVLFVGGCFTEKKVEDGESAIEAMKPMMQLLGINEENQVLFHTRTCYDKDGNTCYRFSVAYNDEDSLFTKTNYALTVNGEGSVLSLSATSSDHLNGSTLRKMDGDDILNWMNDKLAEKYPSAEGWELVSKNLSAKYMEAFNERVYVAYAKNEKTGELVQLAIDTNLKVNESDYDVSLEQYTKYAADDLEYSEACETYTLKATAFANDQFFRRAEEYWKTQDADATREKEFVDYYGNVVSLPVAYDKESNSWYICDTDRHIIGMQQMDGKERGDELNISQLSLMRFPQEYFDAVAEYKESLANVTDRSRKNMIIQAKAFDDLLEEKVAGFTKGVKSSEDSLEKTNYTTTFISSMESAIAAYDTYNQNTNIFTSTPIGIFVSWICDDANPNASCGYSEDSLVINVFNNAMNASMDCICHELGHGLWDHISCSSDGVNTLGAMQEAYADIVGKLAELMYVKDPTAHNATDTGFVLNSPYTGYVDFEKWTTVKGDPDELAGIRVMGDPTEKDHPVAVNDTNYFKPVKATECDEDNDFGGVHRNAGILNNICFRMMKVMFADEDGNYDYKKCTMSELETTFRIWYNSMQYLNRDSTFSTVKAYIRQSMVNFYKAQGEDASDAEHRAKIDAVAALFDEANVHACDDYTHVTVKDGETKEIVGSYEGVEDENKDEAETASETTEEKESATESGDQEESGKQVETGEQAEIGEQAETGEQTKIGEQAENSEQIEIGEQAETSEQAEIGEQTESGNQEVAVEQTETDEQAA